MTFEHTSQQQSEGFDRIKAASKRSDVVALDGTYISYHIRNSGIYVCATSRSGLSASRIVSWSSLCLCNVDPLVEAEITLIQQIRPAMAPEVTHVGC